MVWGYSYKKTISPTEREDIVDNLNIKYTNDEKKLILNNIVSIQKYLVDIARTTNLHDDDCVEFCHKFSYTSHPLCFKVTSSSTIITNDCRSISPYHFLGFADFITYFNSFNSQKDFDAEYYVDKINKEKYSKEIYDLFLDLLNDWALIKNSFSDIMARLKERRNILTNFKL